MRITDNTIFIPGATSGIGRALAVALHERGNTVIIGGRRRALLDEIAQEHPGIDTVEIDTADAASIEHACAEVLERHPGLDGLITMAGIMRAEDWTGSDFLGSAEATVQTNVLGPIRLLAAFLPHLQTRPEATVMTVSSGLAFAPLMGTPTYNASKAAMHMLSESIRLQLAGTSVSVLELVPPAVQTDIVPGHATSDVAMPLAEYVDEVLEIIEGRPEVTEIQVERVKFLRYGEARGDYPQVVAALNQSDPLGKS